MKHKFILLVVSIVMALFLPTNSYAQFGNLKSLGKMVKNKVTEKVNKAFLKQLYLLMRQQQMM